MPPVFRRPSAGADYRDICYSLFVGLQRKNDFAIQFLILPSFSDRLHSGDPAAGGSGADLDCRLGIPVILAIGMAQQQISILVSHFKGHRCAWLVGYRAGPSLLRTQIGSSLDRTDHSRVVAALLRKTLIHIKGCGDILTIGWRYTTPILFAREMPPVLRTGIQNSLN